MERLQKVMAHAGIASRRKSEEIIEQGRVRVNGEVVTELGYKVTADDSIEVDGEEISREKRVYLLFNKPPDCISTVSDPRGRKTVLDYIQGVSRRIYPVGRLDYDTSGLLLLTNDGELTYHLTHPSHEIEKTYQVTVQGFPRPDIFKALEVGIELEDGLTAPARVENIKRGKGSTTFILTIHEGRNRQVRRMCQAVGYPVIRLVRVRFAFLTIGKLNEGEYRFLSKKEISRLKQLGK